MVLWDVSVFELVVFVAVASAAAAAAALVAPPVSAAVYVDAVAAAGRSP